MIFGRGFGAKFKTCSGLRVFYISNNQINTRVVADKVISNNLLICLWIKIHPSLFYLAVNFGAKFNHDVPGEVGKRERKEILELVILSHPFSTRFSSGIWLRIHRGSI